MRAVATAVQWQEILSRLQPVPAPSPEALEAAAKKRKSSRLRRFRAYRYLASHAVEFVEGKPVWRPTAEGLLWEHRQKLEQVVAIRHHCLTTVPKMLVLEKCDHFSAFSGGNKFKQDLLELLSMPQMVEDWARAYGVHPKLVPLMVKRTKALLLSGGRK